MICVPFIQNTLLRECGPESGLFPRLRAPKKGPPRRGRRAVCYRPSPPRPGDGTKPHAGLAIGIGGVLYGTTGYGEVRFAIAAQ
jgi:hypothetical protein